MRVLLAEDERLLSDAIVAILNRNGYSVDAVYNGDDAFDYLSYGDYDAAILDIMMPKKDGIEVLCELRASGHSLPVLMLTAKSEISDKVTGLDSGADDYLTKPFDTSELLARLRAILRRQPELEANDLTFGDIKLSRADNMLHGPAGRVRLPNKEYQILESFMRLPGRIVSTDSLMEHIWGCDSEAEVNVVWVNISGLRKKLADIGSHTAIKASRGAGYFLEEQK